MIDPDASYLISGGLGGLGLAVARRLARHGARRLALVGRGHPAPSAQAAVASLRQDGVEVITYRADIADREQAQTSSRPFDERWGRCGGLFTPLWS